MAASTRLVLRSAEILGTCRMSTLRSVCCSSHDTVVATVSDMWARQLHTTSAGYAKHAKHSGKTGSKSKEPQPAADITFAADEVLDKCDRNMTKSLEYLTNELAGVRSGRAHPGLIQHIQVNAHGEHVPLKACGVVVVRNNQLLAVTVHDSTLVDAVVTAIRTSPLQLNARSEAGEVLVPIPRLSGDTLIRMGKLVKKEAEDAKVSLRHARHSALEVLKKAPLSTDERKALEQQVQKLHDGFVKTVEQLQAAKEKELQAQL